MVMAPALQAPALIVFFLREGSHCLTAQVDSAVLLYSIVRVTCQEFTHDW